MLKELLKRFYFRIYFSKYYLQLSGLRKLYCLGSLREFTANLDAFYQELVQFPYLYYGQHSVQQGDELPYPLSPLPEVPMKDIYAGNKELLSEIETFVKKGISNEIPVLLNDIESFLDNVFDSMNAHKYTFNRYKS